MSTPIEAQECANCYYARPTNLFKPNATASNDYVHCHHDYQDTGAAVLCSAWCGKWKLHPRHGGSLNDDGPLTVYA